VEKSDIERLLGGPQRITYENIVAHPRMPEARKLYIDRFLEVYGGDPFLVRLLIQSGRFFVFHLVLLAEAMQDPARRETWATVSRIKEMLAAFGTVSERQVDHVLARLCEVGFVEIRQSTEDRRVRLLSSTEKFREHDRDWLVAHYSGLALLYPEHDYGLVMRRDPDFQMLLRSVAAPLTPIAVRLMATVPDMMMFFDHAGGYPVIAALIQAAMAEPDGLHAAVPYADMGDRFGVSRAQVRKLLLAAEEKGLVKLHARGGRRVEILPRFWTEHDRSIGVGMYINELAYLAAIRTMERQARATPASPHGDIARAS
jgi:DNA-binding transcriptional ArsR family regulator